MSPMDPNRDTMLYKVVVKEVQKDNLHNDLGDPDLTQFKLWFLHDSQNGAKGNRQGGLEILLDRIANQIHQKSTAAVRMHCE
jgi:hypothetical protein